MQSLPIRILILLATLSVQASHPSPEPLIFVASTPCDRIPGTMLSIPASADCELIKWTLVLHRDPRNQSPTVYKLSYTYGMSKPNTTGFMNGGTRLEKEGHWVILNDTKHKEIYRLTVDTPETTISFTKLDDNLLHLLDPQGKLMIGHGSWSYTLNRK